MKSKHVFFYRFFFLSFAAVEKTPTTNEACATFLVSTHTRSQAAAEETHV